MAQTSEEALAYRETPEYQKDKEERAKAALQKQYEKEAKEDEEYEELAQLMMRHPPGRLPSPDQK